MGTSLIVVCLSTALALAIGMVSAAVASVIQDRNALTRALTVCLDWSLVLYTVFPLVLQASVWEQTLGKFGWASVSAGRSFDAGRSFQSMTAVVWIHGLSGVGIIHWAMRMAMKGQSAQVVRLAAVEHSPWQRVRRIHIKLLWPAVAVAAILVSVRTANEMSVTNLYAVVTVTERFYLQCAVDPAISRSMFAVASPSMFAAISILLVQRFALRNRSIHTVAGQRTPVSYADSTPNGSVETFKVATAVLYATTLMAVLLIPTVLSTTIKLGQTVEGFDATMAGQRLLDGPRQFLSEASWTIAVAVGSGGLAFVFATGLVILTNRIDRRWCTRLMQAAMWVLFCLPGPLVGLSVVRLFSVNVGWIITLRDQTLIPLWLATMAKSVPILYCILTTSIQRMPITLRRMCVVQYAPVQRIVRFYAGWLVGPSVAGCLLAGWLAAGDVAVTLPVAPAGVSTLATRLFGLLHSGARFPEAVLTIWYVIGSTLVVAAIHFGLIHLRKLGSTKRAGSDRHAEGHQSLQ